MKNKTIETIENGKRKHSIMAYVTTVLAVLSLVKCAGETHAKKDEQPPAKVHKDTVPMPYMKKIGGCRYILTPDYGGRIQNTIHAGDCPNELHQRRQR